MTLLVCILASFVAGFVTGSEFRGWVEKKRRIRGNP